MSGGIIRCKFSGRGVLRGCPRESVRGNVLRDSPGLHYIRKLFIVA